MARGGIYDHLGGGFHRYSVDERWLVPHFEKMLYDNALLVPVYVDAWQVTDSVLFAKVVRETLDYIIREMTTTEGGYCAAQDADTEGEEGKFFVWTPEQVEDVIDDDETARLFCAYYDITPHGNFEGNSILHLDAELDEQARLLGVSPQVLQAAVEQGRRRLFEARTWRVAPGRDDKVVVAWNGLMITAMARGYQAFGEAAWLDSATRAAQFLLDNLIIDADLRHSWKDGQAPVLAFQDDYAAFVTGLIDLYEASLDSRWLVAAIDLADRMVERFWDAKGDSGFFYADEGKTDLIVRTKNPFDGATPSGNSMATLALLRLATLTEKTRFSDRAVATLRAYADLLEKAPAACCLMASALSQYRSRGLELTIMGEEEVRRPFLRMIHDAYLPNRVISGATPADTTAVDVLPVLRDRHPAHDGGAQAFVCYDATCSAPMDDASDFAKMLASNVRGNP
jgi:hypothetical protein